MSAGQKYFVLVGGPGTTVPQPGGVQVQVTFVPPPPNDSCASPIPLTLGVPVFGTTAAALNDYQLSATAPTCFTLPSPPAPLGQTASTAPGRDVVYSFTPAATGLYSVRAYGYNTSQNLVLYVANTCPTPVPGQAVTINNPPCLGASNRVTSTWQEEVMCVPMSAGQTYYAFVDDNTSGNAGSVFYIKAVPCLREAEQNDTPATANPFLCGIEGSIGTAGDKDFFQLTGATSGSRVFALADGSASAGTDYDMRITNKTDTLQYDDYSADSTFGSIAPTIDGVTLTNSPPYYIEMTYYSATSTYEPYRLYAVVEPPYIAAIPETEPNDTLVTANANTLNYFKGTMSATTDQDWYTFTANAGDAIFVGLDTDPNYDGTANDLLLTLYDATGSVLVTVNGSTGTAPTLNRPPTAGNLMGTTPVSYGEALEWNAAYTGTYYAKVAPYSGSGQEYALAISKNCATDATDFAITKSGSPDPVATGQNLTYNVIVTNNGPGAGAATMKDTLPAGVTFLSVLSPAGWTCTTPPVGGTGAVNCTGALAAGDAAPITIVVKVDWCWGNVQFTNAATITASGTDPVPTNNTATFSSTVTDNGLCSDNNACTNPDVCVGTVCQPGTARDCSDTDPCTVDTCDPATGDCIHTDMCELDVFPSSRAQVDLRYPPDLSMPHIVELNGPTTVRVNLGMIGDPDGDGLEQVPTEMLQLQLTGMSPEVGHVQLRLQLPSPPHPVPPHTLGEIEEGANHLAGRLDVPPFDPSGPVADSFFDVFFEVELVDQGGMVLHNHVPKHMTARIRHKPPAPGDAYENPDFIDLFDANDNPMPVRVGPGLHVPTPCGSDADCNDNNLCTTDACNQVTGACVYTAVSCDDQNPCTADSCDPTTGACHHTPMPGATCNDGNLCTNNDACGCVGGTSLSENFDNLVPPALPAGWTTTLVTGQTGDLPWTTVTTLSQTPPNSAFADDPSHITDKVLVSPSFTASIFNNLTFYIDYATESTFDGAVLEININGGGWGDILTTGGSFVSGGYNGTISTGYSSPIAGRQAWTGSSSGWILSTVTLPAAANGQSVQLRWWMASDTSVGSTGVYIDTVSLPVCNVGCTGTPVTCTAQDQCHVAGTCDPLTGLCDNPPAPDGTACDDGNVCTNPDKCFNGVCLGPRVPAPPEINSSVLVQPFGGGGGGRIVWSDAPGPYNVYRGYRSGAWVYNHTCFDPNIPAPVSTDMSLPAVGETFYYLVSRRDVCGESIVGRDGYGAPEPNPTPCP